MGTLRSAAVVATAVGMLAACSSSSSSDTPTTVAATTTASTGASTTTSGAATKVAATVAAVASTGVATSTTAVAVTVAPTAVPSTAGTAAAPDLARCAAQGTSTKVVIWHALSSDSARAELQVLADEYGAGHGVTVELDRKDDQLAMLSELGATDPEDWPSVIIAGDSAVRELVDSDHFLRPSTCADVEASRAAMLAPVRARYTFDGDLAAVPFGVSTLVLLFDKAGYTKAGLDPTKPLETEDELLETIAKIRASGVADHGLALDDHCVDWALDQYAAKRGELIAAPTNGHDSGPAVVDYATPTNVDVLAKLQVATRDGDIVFIGGNAATFGDLQKIIDPSDSALMTVHTTASIGDLRNLLAANNFDGIELGVLPLPGPGAGGLAGGNALFLVDRGDAGANRSGWEVVSWLSAPEQLARFDAATGYIPPSAAVAAQPAIVQAWQDEPGLRVGFDQLAALPDGPAAGGVLFGPNELVARSGYAACSRLLGTFDDPHQVLTDLSADVNNYVAAYHPS